MRDGEFEGARQIRMFQLHLAGYVIVGLMLGIVNFLSTPEHLWFVYYLVAWGAPLAVHVAYVMGLLGGPRA